MIVKDILRVIYSPVKAFESIVKKPDIKGPLIILALILVSVAVEQYVFASKVFLADRTPSNDQWTGFITSSWIWSSNGVISIDNSTYVTGTNCTKSIISNDTSIRIKLANVGALNCVGDEGYERMSFWINWTHQLGRAPSNSMLRLFSVNETRYFELDLTGVISNSSREWSVPVPGIAVGPENQNWVSVNSSTWENIVGLEFILNWSSLDRANLILNIDDLYFAKKPYSFVTTRSLTDYFSFSFINTIIGFFLTWLIYIGSFYIVATMFHQKIGSFRALFTVLGYAFAIAIVGILVRAVLYSRLPALSFPISSWQPSTSDDSIRASIMIERFWYPNIVYPLALIANLGLDLWIVALCAISVRAVGGLSWKKAALFAAFAYIIKFFLFGGSMI